MPADPNVHVGVGAFVSRGGLSGTEILLVKRREDATHGGGTWAMPGGWIDYGQSIVGAARREVLEETGVWAFGGVINDIVTNTYDDQRMHIICISVTFDSYDDSEMANVEPEKHDEVRWVYMNDLKLLDLFPATASLVRLWGWLDD